MASRCLVATAIEAWQLSQRSGHLSDKLCGCVCVCSRALPSLRTSLQDGRESVLEYYKWTLLAFRVQLAGCLLFLKSGPRWQQQNGNMWDSIRKSQTTGAFIRCGRVICLAGRGIYAMGWAGQAEAPGFAFLILDVLDVQPGLKAVDSTSCFLTV